MADKKTVTPGTLVTDEHGRPGLYLGALEDGGHAVALLPDATVVADVTPRA